MRPRSHLLVHALAALWLAAVAPHAWAHDTWFEPRAAGNPADVVMALGTGNQFPLLEYPIGIEQLRAQGCRRGDARAVPLVALRALSSTLVIHADVGRDTGDAAVSCWAQLMPFDIELAPDKIELYLKEVHPPQAVLDAWAEMRSRGLAWKERYTKHARIEFAGSGAAQPVAMGMDVLLESGLGTVRAGDPLVFRVLRDGVPLPDFAVELRGDRSRLGIWRKTDAEGRVRITAPLAGKWVLRGVDLRLSESLPDTWESRFVTLAFEVAEKMH